MNKITRATFKSFINKNKGKLFIKIISDFDGMIDCTVYDPNAEFKPAILASSIYPNPENDLGYQAIWLVGRSRDYFSHYNDDNFSGIKVYNSCGSFIAAIAK